MLVEPTLSSLNQLKLHGMAAALSEQLTQTSAQGLSFEERLGLLIDRELTYRDCHRRINTPRNRRLNFPQSERPILPA